jgi:DNA polymerase-4
MFLHVVVPGFHAALHQARELPLRGRPVAVAIDAGAQAPILAVSSEARSAGIAPGLRADQARRRLPCLAIRTPDPELAEEVQRALSVLCATYAPLVGGSAGRLDVDLGGTESYWSGRLPGLVSASAAEQARHLAGECRRRCDDELHLTAFIGVGHRLLPARLAARLAQDPAITRLGIHAISQADAHLVIDPLPVGWLPGCGSGVGDQLRSCGLTTIGTLRALALPDLDALLGPAAAGLHATLHGTVPDEVPPQIDPEPSISAGTLCGAGGAGPLESVKLIDALARELGVRLRDRHLGCTALTFEGRWIDGRVEHHRLATGYQLSHDRDLAALAERLLTKARDRRVHWERLRLTASGLCAVEHQQELFAPARDHRLESVQDRLRQRFGTDLLRVVGPPLRAGV